jgi:hypothetical protein
MYDDRINKILGTGPVNVRLRTPENTFGNMKCNINSQELITKISTVLDKMPEVKRAQGKIIIELADGKKTQVLLNYRDYK